MTAVAPVEDRFIGMTPVIEVMVEDELDVGMLPRLRERLQESLSLRPEVLRVDLCDCSLLDSQALTLLLETHREAWKQGTRLVLRGCNAAGQRLLALAGLIDVFELEDADGPHLHPHLPHGAAIA